MSIVFRGSSNEALGTAFGKLDFTKRIERVIGEKELAVTLASFPSSLWFPLSQLMAFIFCRWNHQFIFLTSTIRRRQAFFRKLELLLLEPRIG